PRGRDRGDDRLVSRARGIAPGAAGLPPAAALPGGRLRRRPAGRPGGALRLVTYAPGRDHALPLPHPDRLAVPVREGGAGPAPPRGGVRRGAGGLPPAGPRGG